MRSKVIVPGQKRPREESVLDPDEYTMRSTLPETAPTCTYVGDARIVVVPCKEQIPILFYDDSNENEIWPHIKSRSRSYKNFGHDPTYDPAIETPYRMKGAVSALEKLGPSQIGIGIQDFSFPFKEFFKGYENFLSLSAFKRMKKSHRVGTEIADIKDSAPDSMVHTAYRSPFVALRGAMLLHSSEKHVLCISRPPGHHKLPFGFCGVPLIYVAASYLFKQNQGCQIFLFTS